jgi:hypothetical protein
MRCGLRGAAGWASHSETGGPVPEPGPAGRPCPWRIGRESLEDPTEPAMRAEVTLGSSPFSDGELGSRYGMWGEPADLDPPAMVGKFPLRCPCRISALCVCGEEMREPRGASRERLRSYGLACVEDGGGKAQRRRSPLRTVAFRRVGEDSDYRYPGSSVLMASPLSVAQRNRVSQPQTATDQYQPFARARLLPSFGTS